MCFLLKLGIFYCHVSLLEGTISKSQIVFRPLPSSKVTNFDEPNAKENATTPLITESVDAEMDQVKDEVEAEDLDTGCCARHAGLRLG